MKAVDRWLKLLRDNPGSYIRLDLVSHNTRYIHTNASGFTEKKLVRYNVWLQIAHHLEMKPDPDYSFSMRRYYLKQKPAPES
jgi:hypothetical protein